MKTITLGHMADLHISHRLRPGERRRAHAAAAEIFREEQADAVAICGDLYDADPSGEDEEELRELLVDLGRSFEVAVIRGNHDPQRKIRGLGQYRTGADLTDHRHPIYAAERDTLWRLRCGLLVCALPHFSKAALAARLGTGISLKEQDRQTMALIDRILEGFRRDVASHPGASVLLAHAEVDGAVGSGGESRREGALGLTVERLRHPGTSCVLLGHIHQEGILDTAGTVWYSGSTYQKTFGERADRKCVITVELDADTGRLRERRVHPLPQTPMVKLEVRWLEDGWWRLEAHAPLAPLTWPEYPAEAEIWIAAEYPADAAPHFHAFRAEALRRYPTARVQGAALPVMPRRCVAFSAVQGLADGLRKWRAADGRPADLPPSLAAKVEEIVAEVGDLPGTAGDQDTGAGLTLGALEMVGFNGFTVPAQIPYQDMRGLICLTGPTGSGKTSVMEATLAALTRSMAYYGDSLPDRVAPGTVGRIAQTFAMAGQTYQSIQTVDKSRKHPAVEAVLLRAGEAVNDPKLLKAFSAAVAAVVGTKERLELTVYSRQNDSAGAEGQQGFFQVDSATRTEQIMDLTGNDRYAAAAALAKARAAARGSALETAEREAQDLLSQTAALEDSLLHGPGLRTQVAAQRATLAAGQAELRAADAAATAAIEREAQIRHRPENAGALQRELTERETERARTAEAGKALRGQIEANQALLMERPAVEAAQAELPGLEALLAAAQANQATAEQDLAESRARRDLCAARTATRDRLIAERQVAETVAQAAHQAEVHTLTEQIQATESRIALAEAEARHAQERARAELQAEISRREQEADRLLAAAVTAKQEAVAAAREPFAGIQRAVSAADLAVLAAEAAETAAQGAVTRASEAAEIRVPCGQLPGCQFLVNAETARQELPELQTRWEAATAAVTAARAAAAAARSQEQAVIAAWHAAEEVPVAAEAAEAMRQTLAEFRARLEHLPEPEVPELDAERRHREDLQRLLAAVPPPDRQEVARLEPLIAAEIAALAELPALAAAVERDQGMLSQYQAEIAARERTLAATRAQAARLSTLALAATTLASQTAERDRLLADWRRLDARCQAISADLRGLAEQEQELAEAAAAKERALHARRSLEVQVQEAQAALGALQGRVSHLEGLLPRAAEKRATADHLAAEQAEWKELERGFGKSGCQALAVEEAGPEIAEYVNLILRECVGTGWRFGLVTQVEKKDGKGMKSQFEPVIYMNGEPQDKVSGGEGAILDIALRLALAIYNGRHSGKRYQVLWLDESGAAIGVEHSETFIRMLRLAARADLGGLEQILLISHQPSVQALCDWVIRLEDRQVVAIDHLSAR